MMAWNSPRKYWHLDHPVTPAFTRKVQAEGFASRHGFMPLIQRRSVTKGYKASAAGGARAMSSKTRLLYLAPHRDAAVFGYAGHLLQVSIEQLYRINGLDQCVVGYRTPAVKNYRVVGDALSFAKAHSPVTVMSFDIVAFFDNLDHAILKDRLRQLLQANELPSDLYSVYKAATAFHFVQESDLSKKIRRPDGRRPVGLRVQDLKDAGVAIHRNPTPGRGIPQGLPISQVLSNIYMLEFDLACKTKVESSGGFYRRYGDDVLVICNPSDTVDIEREIFELVAKHRLQVNPLKKAIRLFDWASPSGKRPLDYLGFSLDELGPLIRSATLARAWAKMKKAFKKTLRAGKAAKAAGKANKVYTKRFHRRFVSTKGPNFISYAQAVAASFDDKRVLQQIRRFRRHGERYLAQLNRP